MKECRREGKGDEWKREDWEEGISRGGQVRCFDAWMKDQVERVYMYIREWEGVTIGEKKREVGIGGRSN